MLTKSFFIFAKACTFRDNLKKQGIEAKITMAKDGFNQLYYRVEWFI